MAFFIPGYRWEYTSPDISELVGKTITEINGAEVNGENIHIVCSDGSEYLMWHSQDCCECVWIEEIFGNIDDLIGVPIAMAECVTNSDDPPLNDYDDSWTWTFYKFATVKGYVTIRWYGESNGWYSEEVDFNRIKEPTEVKGE